jgi:hypothetical protein
VLKSSEGAGFSLAGIKKRCKSLSINELRAAAGPFAVTHYRSVTYEGFFLN